MRPGAGLAGVVDRFWSIEGVADGGAAANRVLPDGCMDVIIDVAGERSGHGVATHGLTRYVVGAMREAVVVGHDGPVDLIGVRFRPGGVAVFVCAPAAELTDGLADLGEFWRDASVLAERLAEAGTDGDRSTTSPPHSSHSMCGTAPAAGLAARCRLRARAGVFERALLGRASAGLPRVDPLVDEATRLIRESRGAARVRDIERALSTTERTLQRRFAATVGLTPKEASRVARFAHAAGRLRRRPAVSLARVALECGYADQPHFTREFQRLAGTTPAAYVRETGVVFVQDGDDPSAQLPERQPGCDSNAYRRHEEPSWK